ncbi:MAG: adenine phosphoribosyltransferase, partial [Planctomycetes bacterium]|nr:adenine phosphoribosyltransferase [Planctomycetota bacterium]
NVAKVENELEYGTDTVEMHVDAVELDQRVLLVDDLLATGGTIDACVKLLQSSRATIVGCAFLVELDFLGGRERLGDLPVISLVRYAE